MSANKSIVLSVVPYFGGSGPAAHSPRERRLGYLRRTVENLKFQFAGPIMVSVCNETDRLAAESLGVIVMLVPNVDPALLPSSTLTILQREPLQADLLYYTEGDQLLSCSANFDYRSILDAGTYLVPHRLEEPYGNVGRDKGPLVRVGDREFVVANDQPEKSVFANNFYVCQSEHSAFGGAYLCTREFFNCVKFQFSQTFPVEHASGFDPFASSRQALKTLRYLDFYVEHLSALDYFKQLAGGVQDR